MTGAKSKQNYKLSTRYTSEVNKFNNLSNKNRACAVYLQELIIFYIYISHCCYNHYKGIKSMDNNIYNKITDAKSKQSYK